jgi:hypothetical protein
MYRLRLQDRKNNLISVKAGGKQSSGFTLVSCSDYFFALKMEAI